MASDTLIEPKERRATVEDLLDALEADYQLRGGRAYKQFRSHLHPIWQAFGHVRTMNVTAARIDRYVKHRLTKGKQPATVNRETQLLGQAFKLGQEHGLVQRVPRIRRLPERNTRQGFFEQEEFEGVVQHLPDYLKDFVRFAYLSGWRKDEFSQLQWSDVDRKARIIRLRPDTSKTQDGRVLVLDDELWELIERHSQERGVAP